MYNSDVGVTSHVCSRLVHLLYRLTQLQGSDGSDGDLSLPVFALGMADSALVRCWLKQSMLQHKCSLLAYMLHALVQLGTDRLDALARKHWA